MLRAAALLAVFLLAFTTAARAQKPYDDERTPEGWAWKQIRDDQIADFNTRDGCNGGLNPFAKAGWDAPCRRLPPQFLVDVLTVPKWRDQISRQRVRLRGADIDGTIDLTDAEITPEVWLDKSRIEGSMVLDDSRWNRRLWVGSSTVAGAFSAWRLRTESSITFNQAAIEGGVHLDGAKVSGTLLMDDRTTFNGDVELPGAKIGGDLAMRDSSFRRAVILNHLSVEGGLYMVNMMFDGDVDLISAKISGDLEMRGTSFAGQMLAQSVNVGGSFNMYDGAMFGGRVSLVTARIGSQLYLSDATAWRVDVSGAEMRELFLNRLAWWCAGARPPVSAGLELLGSGAEISPAHWRLGDDSWRNVHCDGPDAESLPILNLHNTHVDEFQDSVEAWPPWVDLNGFYYERLGGQGGSERNDMGRRALEKWTDWLARDRTFNPQPYTTLSSVLAGAGHRDLANAVQLAGREREREEACANLSSPRSCAWLTFLSYGDSYGIGLYTFSVLAWVVGFTGLGADVLWYSPNARKKGYLWRFGASLHRLLPIAELSKQFKNFFDDPDNLGRYQCIYFAVHALAGWGLGLILLAAMAGLTQKG